MPKQAAPGAPGAAKRGARSDCAALHRRRSSLDRPRIRICGYFYSAASITACETHKKERANSALCTKYTTFFPICTPPTLRQILSPFAREKNTRRGAFFFLTKQLVLWYSNPCPVWGYGGIAQLARACGSYPQCPRFKSRCRYHMAGGRAPRLSRRTPRPVGQVVKTRPFHGCNMGSNPVRVTICGLSSAG